MRPPDQVGRAGRAWKALAADKTKPDHEANIQSWLVNRPGAHPFWSWWVVACCSLRDLPGVPPANKEYPEAEYEFIIFAINPDRCPNPDPDQMAQGYPFLVPFDVCMQFDGVSDTVAEKICELAVGAIVSGAISPDQDYRAVWINTIRSTVKHYIEGMHEDDS